MDAELHHRFERIVHDEFGRVIAALARRFGDLEVAEEALVSAMSAGHGTGSRPTSGRA
jgi:predicted RNA polymerase sigma factor